METIRSEKSYATGDDVNRAGLLHGWVNRSTWQGFDGQYEGQNNGHEPVWAFRQQVEGGPYVSVTGFPYTSTEAPKAPVTEHGGELSEQVDPTLKGPVSIDSLQPADKFFIGVNAAAYRDCLKGDPWYTLLSGRASQVKAAINYASYEYGNWAERGKHTYTGPLLSYFQAVVSPDNLVTTI